MSGQPFIDNTSPLLISFSGGKTSAFMTWYLFRKYPNRKKIVVFANTGKEREETLEFVHACDQAWNLGVVWVEAETNPEHGKGVTAKVVDFKTASRKGEPFEAMIAKHGIPNKALPHCTRELKSYAIRAYARSIGWKKTQYVTAIGYRVDEPKRVKWAHAAKERLIYPLVSDFPVNKQYIDSFWAAQGFSLNLQPHQGNCDMCWKKSKRKLFTLLSEKAEAGDWWERMEEKYGDYVPLSRQHNSAINPPFTFYRGGESMKELREEMELTGFSKWREPNSQLELLMFSDPELDHTGGCEESCEVFTEDELHQAS